jgi:hypothetical protein
VNSYFVYRDFSGDRWYVSERNTERDGEWDVLTERSSWREAFDFAYETAREDRERFRPWWPPNAVTP